MTESPVRGFHSVPAVGIQLLLDMPSLGYRLCTLVDLSCTLCPGYTFEEPDTCAAASLAICVSPS